MYDVLYQGNTPPSSFDDLSVVEAGVDEATLTNRWNAGRVQNNNYSIVVRVFSCVSHFRPPAVVTPQPKVLSWGALATYLIGLLGGGAPGRAALGAIIKSCQASALGADNFFAVYFQGQTEFSKAEFTAVLGDVATVIVSAGQKTAVSNNWPVA